MTKSNDIITLAHGSGGRTSQQLIEKVILPMFDNTFLAALDDSAVLGALPGPLAFTTDSYVIDPIFFPGGDIGKLAICGTINDLAMQGARPVYLSAGLILEEGLPIAQLSQIIESMATTARGAGVRIVTGDTKVVPAGKADKIFINTAGIGQIVAGSNPGSNNARLGDAIILTGTMADHGTAITSARAEFKIECDLESDLAPLHELIQQLLSGCPDGVHVLRDPTRGGIASALNEIAAKSDVGIALTESDIPIRPEVSSICDLLGFDPLYVANEGKALIFIAPELAEPAIQILRNHPLGRQAQVIGRVVSTPKKVYLITRAGGQRIIDWPAGEQLPRIC